MGPFRPKPQNNIFPQKSHLSQSYNNAAIAACSFFKWKSIQCPTQVLFTEIKNFFTLLGHILANVPQNMMSPFDLGIPGHKTVYYTRLSPKSKNVKHNQIIKVLLSEKL